ncbi:hypothetical protein Q3G72_032906 [Acer saccharum]|nr:hypothetical protein Q3G72_032906 [Acer saccharum]
MHGLMKDLADFVTGDFSFQLEDKVMDGDQNTIFDKARHSSYLRSRRELLTKFEVFNGAECLRTFLPLDPTGEIGVSYLANEVPYEEEVYKVSKPEICQDLTNSTRFPSFREAMGANRQESVEFKLGQWKFG